MSTLAEIESAVDRLPPEQQEALLHHLAATVRRRRGAAGPAAAEQWMQRLDALRASIGSGTQAIASEEILEAAREERR
jgi:hypothetical protein